MPIFLPLSRAADIFSASSSISDRVQSLLHGCLPALTIHTGRPIIGTCPPGIHPFRPHRGVKYFGCKLRRDAGCPDTLGTFTPRKQDRCYRRLLHELASGPKRWQGFRCRPKCYRKAPASDNGKNEGKESDNSYIALTNSRASLEAQPEDPHNKFQ